MGGNVLKLILYFGWFTGCFPSQVPSQKSERFNFRWLHPVMIFSLLIVIFDVGLMVDFGVNSVVNYAEMTLGSGLSAVIVECGRVFNIAAGDASVRILGIFTCPLIIELVLMIQKLEALRRNPCKFCHYMYKAYVTILLANIFHLTYHYIRVSNFINFFKPIPWYVKLTIIPDVDWMIRLAFWLQNFFIVSSLSFASSICILLGTNLISLYLGFCNELKICWGVCKMGRKDSNWMGEVDFYLETFIEKFKELKRGFEIFSVVAGPLVFCVYMQLLLSLIHSVFSLSTSQALKSIPGTFGCIFWIAFVAFFGNFMETKVRHFFIPNFKNKMTGW